MRWLGLGMCLVLGGCGLVLDLDAPDDGGTFDARVTPKPDADTRECVSDGDCADGNVCNGDESCRAGQCVDGAMLACDDGVACTADRCDPAQGCVVELDHSMCADAVGCTEDRCDPAAGCVHQPVDAHCAPGTCDPGTGCSPTDCVTAADCTAAPCQQVTCEAGLCVRQPVDDVACDDGNACTEESTCVDGSCLGKARLVCAARACTRCDPVTGCDPGQPATGVACDDGDLCTEGDLCQDGVCAPGTPVTCPDTDRNPCIVPVCRPTERCAVVPVAVSAAVACDDGDQCTSSSWCDGEGGCTVSTPTCDGRSDRCRSLTCVPSADGTAECVLDEGTCGENSVCLASAHCECESGFDDCNGDGHCECDLDSGVCLGAVIGRPRCVARLACSLSCGPSQVCCPCTGLCHTPGDGACARCEGR